MVLHVLGSSSLLLKEREPQSNTHLFSSTIAVANKEPIKNTFFSAQKVSGERHEVTSGINPGRAHQDRVTKEI